jgi:hypothetical protein
MSILAASLLLIPFSGSSATVSSRVHAEITICQTQTELAPGQGLGLLACLTRGIHAAYADASDRSSFNFAFQASGPLGFEHEAQPCCRFRPCELGPHFRHRVKMGLISEHLSTNG